MIVLVSNQSTTASFPTTITILPSGNYLLKAMVYNMVINPASSTATSGGVQFKSAAVTLIDLMNFAFSAVNEFLAAATSDNRSIDWGDGLLLTRGNSVTLTLVNNTNCSVIGCAYSLYGDILP